MSESPYSPAALQALLEELGIATRTVEHPPVFTVDEAKRLRPALPGGHCKNLFLRNKRGELWLVVALEDTGIDLVSLSEALGTGRLGFASERRLRRHLGVEPGSVTPFAVVNDEEGAVTVVLERAMLAEDLLHYHPLVNTQTTSISPAGLIEFLEHVDHPPVILDI